MKYFFSVAILLAGVGALYAQAVPSNQLVNASTGYNLNVPQQPAAPGQILVLSVFGIKGSFPQPLPGTPVNNEFPKMLGGITVDLLQEASFLNPAAFSKQTITPVELRGIQQAFCSRADVCTTVTGITVQIPFELSLQTYVSPMLRVSENGNVVGLILLRPVSDSIHVLNTCDGTLISISAAVSVPQDVCAPVAQSHQKLNSLYNLLREGDGVAVSAYGLGALAGDGPNGTKALQNRFQVSFDFRPNAAASRAVPGFGATDPLFAGYYTGGLYQVNFAIPAIPAGVPACDGSAIKSNLTATITGPNSFDAVPLCVAPRD